VNDEYKKMLERFEQICQNAKKELCGKKEKEQEKKFIEKIDKELTISEYDEIEYWLANVEILDKTDYILNNRKAKILVRYLKEKQQEIERLNNIINEIEDSIVGKINVLYQVRGQSNAIQELNILLRQLRELKGDGSNE